jgi:hypothetical protein
MDIATKLVQYDAPAHGWGELTKRGAQVEILLFDIHFALGQAQKEALRPAASEEEKMHAELLAAIDALQIAIARSPLPPAYPNKGGHWSDRLGGVEAFHWRARDAMQGPFPYPGPGWQLCLEDVLEFAKGQAGYYQAVTAARPRTVARQRVRPETNAFIIHLASLFEGHFGDKLQGTLAHIATAVFGVEISKQQVVGVLRNRCDNERKNDAKPT